MMKVPESNYRFFVEAMQNKKPARMPIYEHKIDDIFIENADFSSFSAIRTRPNTPLQQPSRGIKKPILPPITADNIRILQKATAQFASNYMGHSGTTARK